MPSTLQPHACSLATVRTPQVPQFILDDAIARGRGGATSIICTQPRRISAMGVAQRVADERAEPLGRMVGYQARLDPHPHPIPEPNLRT